MRSLIAVVLLLIGCFIHAEDNLKINGEFKNSKKNIPSKWILNSALKGDIKIIEKKDANIATITATGTRVHIYSAVQTPASAGDKLTLTVKTKGTGTAIIGAYLYCKTGGWIGINKFEAFEVEPDWKEKRIVIDLIDFKEKKLGIARVLFGVKKDSVVSFTNLKATIAHTAKSGKVQTSVTPPKAVPVPKSVPNIPFTLVLPKTAYAVPGIKTGIYIDNIIITKTPNEYALKTTPENLGESTDSLWSIIPVDSQIGTHELDLDISIKDNKKIIANGKISLNIAPANAGEGTKLNLLIIGDSLTGATQYPRKIAQLLSQKGNPALTMLGTQKKGKGVAHEGYGGWTWNSFIKKYTTKPAKRPSRGSSPFVFLDAEGDPKLDVPRYFKERCDGVTPDVITIFLGINDCFSFARNLNDLSVVNKRIDKVFSAAEIFISALREAAPKAIIGICLTPPPNSRQGAFYANYKNSYSRWGWKQIQHILVGRQIKHFGNRQKENIYVIPTELYIDCVDGYPSNNGVHPNKKGYNQIATSIYCWLKWQLHTNKLLK